MAAAAEVISWVEKRCGGGRYPSSSGNVDPEDNLMCTTGNINLWPNAFNVIPGSANFTLDIRYSFCSQQGIMRWQSCCPIQP